LLEESLKQQREWTEKVPGLDEDGGKTYTGKQRTTTVEESLLLLRQEQAAAAQLSAENLIVDSTTGDAKKNYIDIVTNGEEEVKLVLSSVSSSSAYKRDTFGDPSEFEDFDDVSVSNDSNEQSGGIAANMVPLASKDANAKSGSGNDGPVVVFIRHGRTPHNNLGLFTGK